MRRRGTTRRTFGGPVAAAPAAVLAASKDERGRALALVPRRHVEDGALVEALRSTPLEDWSRR